MLFYSDVFVVEVDSHQAEIVLEKTGALCSFYAEEGGQLIGYEGAKKY